MSGPGTVASSAGSGLKPIGFSVKDILDLPSTKSRSSSAPSLTALRSDAASSSLAALDSAPLSETCVPPNSYHPAAIYYCDSSYARWLPPTAADMFPYTAPLREYLFRSSPVLPCPPLSPPGKSTTLTSSNPGCHWRKTGIE